MAQHASAYVTLVMTDSYLPGAMVLGHSLKDRGAKGRLAACVLLDRLSLDTISELQTVYDDIVPVQQVINMQPANLYLMNRPDLISTFTKIELWKQTQYKRLVYIDADVVALRAPNELLTMETDFAAVPDVGWPDCFNSGVMVLNPNMGDYYSLLALANRGISFDGADQGLLNMHFTQWERLSFALNCTPSANYQYVPAYKHFQSSIAMIHFIGAEKPWTQGRDHKSNVGVYGELLGRWWSVYDRHYRTPKSSGYGQYVQPRRRIQDYVRGEETRYEPSYQSEPQQQSQKDQRTGSGYQITQPRPEAAPGIHVSAPEGDSDPIERPFGDQPGLAERIRQEHYKPTSTQEQRRFSAPYSEWEPTRQPPPANSKPEAANFPSQQYEMSDDKNLFEPPEKYPEPPTDMWYNVPGTKPERKAPLKPIFPWEERAVKATRVFPRSREESPPESSDGPSTSGSGALASQPTSDASQAEHERQSSLSQGVSRAFSQSEAPPKPPSPSRHIFPWEGRAPKATRVFHQPAAFSAPTNTQRTNSDTEASITGTSEDTQITRGGPFTPPQASDNPWDAFSHTNKWDEDPEIARFMESFHKPRRAPVQLVQQSGNDTSRGPPPAKERRTSMKLTDFPTEMERPSLPVTPAPMRRSTLWGTDERQIEENVLPLAQGVPRQDEWNPVIKLEELQRRQSLVMSGEDRFETKTPPRREMPESNTREEAIEATMKAMNPSNQRSKIPTKPILKEPHFEITEADDGELGNESIVSMAHTTATGSKSPTRFNPIVLEGEAASERTVYNDSEHSIPETTSTAATHKSSSGFPYSTSSLSPDTARSNYFHEAVDAQIPENQISPTQVA